MKILLIHQYFLEKKDGGGSRFNQLTKNWSDDGHHVTVLAGMIHYNSNEKREKYKSKYIFIDNNFYKNVDVIRCHAAGSQNINFLGRFWSYISFVISSIYAGIFAQSWSYLVLIVGILPICWIVNEHIGLICRVIWTVYAYSCRFYAKKVTSNAHNFHLIDLTEAFVVQIKAVFIRLKCGETPAAARESGSREPRDPMQGDSPG